MVMMLFIDGLRNIPVIEMILVSYLMRLSAVLCKAYAMLKIYECLHEAFAHLIPKSNINYHHQIFTKE